MDKPKAKNVKNTIIKNNAEIISDIILKINTDIRGYLFLEIGKKLSEKQQFYTATIFKNAAIEYGITENNND